MNDFKEQWNKVDWDFLKEFANLHNLVSCKKKTQQDFNEFVMHNKDKFDNPDYLQVFVERVDIFNENFLKDNFEMCKVFYDFMKNNPDWTKLDLGLRTMVRLEVFEEKFEEFLSK